MKLNRGLLLPGLPQVLIAVVVVVGVYVWRERQRAEELARAEQDGPEARVLAFQEIEQFVVSGSDGVPELISLLSDRDAYRRRLAVAGLGRIGRAAAPALDAVGHASEDSDPQLRRQAIRAYCQIAEPSEAVARRMAGYLEDPEPETQGVAAECLLSLKLWAIGPTIEVLQSGSPATRLRALEILESLWEGGKSEEIILAVRRKVQDPDPVVARRALTWLVRTEVATDGEIRDLFHAACAPTAETGLGRMTGASQVDLALAAIQRRGPAAAEFVPDLVLRLENLYAADEPNSSELTWLLTILSGLKTAARPAIPVLKAHLRDGDAGTIDVLAAIGMDVNELTPLVVRLLDEALRHASWEGIRSAGALLVRVNPVEARQQVARMLNRVWKQDSQEVDLLAVEAVKGLAAVAEEAVPVLLELTDSPSTNIVNQAVETLGLIGPAATRAVPVLTAWLRGRKSSPQIIVEALAGIGPPAADALPVLVEVVDDPGKFCPPEADSESRIRLRRAAIEALRRIRTSTPEVLDCLFRRLEEPDEQLTYATMNVLADLDSGSERMVIVFGSLLDDSRPEVRQHAAEIIGRNRLSSPQVVAGLIRIAQDTGIYLRMAGLVALARLGPVAIPALPVLRELQSQVHAWPVEAQIRPAVILEPGRPRREGYVPLDVQYRRLLERTIQNLEDSSSPGPEPVSVPDVLKL